MKSILINYEFGISVTAGFDAICSTDQRNLWCALLVQAIKDELGMQPLFPQDVTAENISSIVCEIHINARKPISSAPLIGLFMETPAVVPQNNAHSAQAYERVISFDHALRHLPNFVEANLPCWSPTFELHKNTARSGYAMIAGNKRLDQSKVQKDLYAERRHIIKWFAKSRRSDFYLYGKGWNVPPQLLDINPVSKFILRKKLYRGPKFYYGVSQNKYSDLSSRKFNLCFENCLYPGYVSEKIFDAIISGCIPVYWGDGAGALGECKDAYIDAGEFPNINALIEFCDRMPQQAVVEMKEKGLKFLKGLGKNFTHEAYCSVIANTIRDLVVKS